MLVIVHTSSGRAGSRGAAILSCCQFYGCKNSQGLKSEHSGRGNLVQQFRKLLVIFLLAQDNRLLQTVNWLLGVRSLS